MNRLDPEHCFNASSWHLPTADGSFLSRDSSKESFSKPLPAYSCLLNTPSILNLLHSKLRAGTSSWQASINASSLNSDSDKPLREELLARSYLSKTTRNGINNPDSAAYQLLGKIQSLGATIKQPTSLIYSGQEYWPALSMLECDLSIETFPETNERKPRFGTDISHCTFSEATLNEFTTYLKKVADRIKIFNLSQAGALPDRLYARM